LVLRLYRSKKLCEPSSEFRKKTELAAEMIRTLISWRPEGQGYTLFRQATNNDFSAMHRHAFSLEPGRCLVSASRRGRRPASANRDLVAGETQTVRIRLLPKSPR